MREDRSYKRAGLAYCLFWLGLFAFPIWWVLATAFKPPIAVSQGPTYFPFLDFAPTVNAFRVALSGARGDFLDPIVNSVLISAASTTLSVLFGSMAAYALVRFEFRVRLLAGLAFAAISVGGFIALDGYFGLTAPAALAVIMVVSIAVCVPLNRLPLPGPVLGNDDVTFWFVSQRMFPPIVAAFALFLLYAETAKAGVPLFDSFVGMTVAYTAFGLPFAIWLMRGFFRSVPVEVEEAALVDNIGRLRIFFQIVLPMSLPGLIATTMIVLAFIWNEFLFALLLTSSKWHTLPMLLAGQNSSRGDEWWAISVATLVAIVPMMVVALLLGRMMRSGLLTGSIK